MSARWDARGLVLPLLALAAWGGASSLGWTDPRLIPSPRQVAMVAWQSASSGDFVAGVAASLARDLLGFGLGASGGAVFGIAVGLSPWVARLAAPSFHALRQVALFAWLPLLVSLLGSGEPARVVFVALSAFYPVALSAIEGVHSIPGNQWELARVYGLDASQRLRRLVLPSSAPHLLAGVHLGLISAWLATIGAEVLLPKQGVGLGDTVIRGRAAFDVALVVFGMVVIGAVGALFSRIATRIETRLLRWRAGVP
jgi:sulfonate transport system permease protein